jgi:fimbrial chaperone protein
VTLQVRSLDWSQSGGEDHYARQDIVVASPPIAQVAPGQRQLVRVIRRAAGAGSAEHSYRLLIDELPKPFDPAARTERTAELAVQMRSSIPLFTYDGSTAAADRPALQARTVLIDGRRFAEISNHGDHHARLTDLRVVRNGQTVSVQAGLVGYVLPGAVMRWPLPDGVPAGGSLVVGVNGGDQTLSPST